MPEVSRSGPGPRIAVAGATGRTGRHLVEQLAADAVEVVALTRDSKAKSLEGIATAEVDFERPETLRAALQGAERLFITHGTSADQVEHEIALIDAAVAAGLRHIVKVSALGPPSKKAPNAWHMRIEDHIARQEIAFTVLRPSVFTYVLGMAGEQVATGTWAGAAGSGRMNFIEPFDVARVARVALLEDVEAGSQRAYHLTGARAWTMDQVAAELSALLNRTVAYRRISPAQRRDALAAAGLPALKVELLVGLDEMFRDSTFGETTHTVEELTGTGPRPLPEWLSENIEVFRR